MAMTLKAAMTVSAAMQRTLRLRVYRMTATRLATANLDYGAETTRIPQFVP